MATNLLELLKEQFSEDVVANLASLIGVSPQNLQSSLNTALPALLTGLVEKSQDAKATGNLFNLLAAAYDGGILSNLGALSRGGEESSKLLANGGNLLASLFGDKAGGIADLVAGAGNISKASSNSLLGFAAPVVLASLSKTLKIENMETVGGLTDFLAGQGSFLKQFAPSGLDALLAGAAAAAPSIGGTAPETPASTAAGLSDFDISVSTLDETSEPSTETSSEFSIGETFEKIDDAIEDFAQESMAAAKDVVEDIGESAGKIGSSIVEESKDFAENAAEMFEEGAESGKKFLPWILIAAALALIWGLLKSCGTSTEPEKPAISPAPPEPAVVAPTPPPVAKPAAEPAITPPPAPSKPEPEAAKEPPPAAVDSNIFEKTLGTGFVIKAAKDGFESKLIGFIEGGEAIRKDLWFTMDGITFDTNRATIKAESMPQINHLVEVLKAYPKVKIKIGGYTDNTGKPAANQKLSENRAKAVKKAVANAGIEAVRVAAEGYGSDNPVASNDTPEGRQQNRRIDVRVTEK